MTKLGEAAKVVQTVVSRESDLVVDLDEGILESGEEV
jgi:hypothetical protein